MGWEYHYEWFDVLDPEGNVLEELANRLSKEGWEMLAPSFTHYPKSRFQTNDEQRVVCQVIFKRPKGQ